MTVPRLQHIAPHRRKFYELVEDIREIQRILAGSREPPRPFLFSGGEYIIWYLCDSHFHPLLNRFPEGVILVHLYPYWLKDASPTAVSVSEIADYCRVALQSRDGGQPTEEPSGQLGIEICGGEEILSTIGQSALFHRFQKSESQEQQNDNQWEALLTHRDPTQRPPGAQETDRMRFPGTAHPPHPIAPDSYDSRSADAPQHSWFQYALIESHLTPIPQKDVRLISMIVHQALKLEKLTLRAPVVFLVDDPPLADWPLCPQQCSEEGSESQSPNGGTTLRASPEAPTLEDPPQPSNDDSQPTQGIPTQPQPALPNDRQADCTSPMMTPPLRKFNNVRASPVYHSRRSVQFGSVRSCLRRDQLDLSSTHSRRLSGDSNGSSLPSSNGIPMEALSWKTFSRRTHLCLFSSQSHSAALANFLRKARHSALPITQHEAEQKEPCQTHPGNPYTDLRLFVQRTPCLALFDPSAEDDAQTLSVAKLASRIFPKSLICRNRSNLPKDGSAGSPASHRDVSVFWRYDVTHGGVFHHLLNRTRPENENDDVRYLEQKACFDTAVMEGPLACLSLSWPLLDPWDVSVFPSLPKPDLSRTVSHKTETTVAFKTGRGPESLLFWFWADLMVLAKLRQLRRPAGEISQGEKAEEDSMKRPAPLHHEREEELLDVLRASCPTAELLNTKQGSDFPLTKYLPVEVGRLPFLARGFLETERSLGQGSIRRRGVARTMASEEGNDGESVEAEVKEKSSGGLTEERPPQQNSKVYPMNSAMEQCWISSELSYEDLSTGLLPPERHDRDFTDQLWRFLRRANTLGDLYDTLQLVLDSIGAAIEIGEPTLGIVRHEQSRPKRSSILGVKNDEPERPTIIPLLPFVRRSSTSRLAELVRLAIRICQLSKYNTSHDNPQELSQAVDQWRRLREYYGELTPCLDLVVEAGIQCLTRDALWIIQRTDPSATVPELEWFTESDIPIQDALARLSRLQKIAELAILAESTKLPWESLRVLLREGISSFKSLKRSDDAGGHPLFVMGLDRQAAKPLIELWSRVMPPVLFGLTAGHEAEMRFELHDGESHLKRLERLFDLYPMLCDKGESETTRPTLYLWESWWQQEKRSDGRRLRYSVTIQYGEA